MISKLGVIITTDKVYSFYDETICYVEKHNVESDKYSVSELVAHGNDELYEYIKTARSITFTYATRWSSCRLVEKVIDKKLSTEEVFELLKEINTPKIGVQNIINKF